MKRLMTTAALAAMTLTGAAHAADTAVDYRMGSASGVVASDAMSKVLRAEDIIGAEVYTLNADYDEAEWLDLDGYAEIDVDWDNVGEVEDIIISRNGNIVGLVVETGGWLDMGDSNYVVDLRDMKVVGDVGPNVQFVTRLSQEEIEQKREVEDQAWF